MSFRQKGIIMSYTMNKLYQKSILNAYSTTNQTLTTDQVIDFTNTNILDGCSISYISGSSSIKLNKAGVYLVTVDAIAAESGTAGTVTMQLQKNGNDINGAKSSSNSAAITDFNGMSFSTVVKVLPSCQAVDNTTTLTVLNTGVGAIYSNANITVIKLC